MGVRGGAQR
jgi:hypothetical protein